MTHRTAALMMLFAGALMITGLVLAGAVSMLNSTIGPWVAPLIAVICQSAVLFVGRHHILPPPLAASGWSAARMLVMMVAGTLIVATITTWMLQWTVGRLADLPSLTLPLWFALLWWSIHRAPRKRWHE